MSEHKTIKLPKTMPLTKRISGVSKEISEWLESLEEPFNVDTDIMRLAKYDINEKYCYYYILERAPKGPDKRTPPGESAEDNVEMER